MKIGFEHKGNWEEAMRKLRRDYRKDLELLVAKTTQDTSRQAKSGVPVRYSGIRQSIKPRVQGLQGEVSARVHYAPYVEYGTGSQVNVPGELREYAMQFKGKGLREVNRRAEPYLYPAFFVQRDRYFKGIKSLLRRAADKNFKRRL